MIAATNAGYFTAKSLSQSRDQQVTTWTDFSNPRMGFTFLRVNAGKAIYFLTGAYESTGLHGFLEIGIVTGLTEGVAGNDGNYLDYNFGTFVPLWKCTDLVSKGIGYSTSETNGKTWTFIADGVEIAAKFGSTEIIRFKQYAHIESGYMALMGWHRNFTFVNISPKEIYSSSNVFDIRDYGADALSVTGSITNGSTSLNVDSGISRFKVGQRIVVETDNYLYGQTAAVGGVWPPLVYANTAAMNADTTRQDSTFARVGGDVYHYFNGYGWLDAKQTWYYQGYSLPKALVTHITAVTPGAGDSGTLTLADAAQKTVSGVNVNLDHYDVMDFFLNNFPYGNKTRNFAAGDFINNQLYDSVTRGIFPTGMTVFVPAGRFAATSPISGDFRPGWTIAGASRDVSEFYSPPAAESFSITLYHSSDSIMRDFHIRDTVWLSGGWLPLNLSATSWGDLSGSFSMGIGSDRGQINDVLITDAAGAAACIDIANGQVNRAKLVNREAQAQYFQWAMVTVDAVDCTFTDIEVDSNGYISAVESFKSYGTKFIRPKIRNGGMSCNSSGGFLIDEPDILIENHSPYQGTVQSNWITPGRPDNVPVVNVNTNADSTHYSIPYGGEIRNPKIVQQGVRYTGAAPSPAIVVNEKNPQIRITGTYPGAVPPKGLLQRDDNSVSVWPAIVASGDATDISGIRCSGAVPAGNNGSHIQGYGYGVTPTPRIRVANCVADDILLFSGTVADLENNISNATYVANSPYTPDSTPNSFTINNGVNLGGGETYTSNTISLSGINTQTAVSVTNCTWSHDYGPFKTDAGFAHNGDDITFQAVADLAAGAVVNCSATVGGVVHNFTVTTTAGDTTPNAFTLKGAASVAPSSVWTTPAVTITGINAASPVTPTNCSWSKNGGSYSSSPGTVVNNDVVTGRVTASGSNNTTITASLDIGGVSSTFTVKTISASPATETVQSLPAMTSDTTPSGVLTSSTLNPSFPRYQAFDKTDSTGWAGGDPAWIKRALDTAIRVGKLRIKGSTDSPLYSPANIVYEVSNDDSSYTVLLSVSGLSWTSGEWKEWTITNTGSWLYHRITGSFSPVSLVLIN
jgi:hypothetical protein